MDTNKRTELVTGSSRDGRPDREVQYPVVVEHGWVNNRSYQIANVQRGTET